MKAKGQLPSAIFVCNDMMAMGVINAASEHGIRIPEDVSIIGYDDIHISKFMNPALTTIHQPKYRLGQAAVEAVLAKVKNPDSVSQVVQLEPTLVTRETVKQL
jgi:LacI family transcriptional regulator